jgi:hypothetical protein
LPPPNRPEYALLGGCAALGGVITMVLHGAFMAWYVTAGLGVGGRGYVIMSKNRVFAIALGEIAL